MSTSVECLTITEAQRRLESGEITSRELTGAYLGRIEAFEPRIQAFITVTREEALAQADAADAARRGGARGALLGVPLAIILNIKIIAEREQLLA